MGCRGGPSAMHTIEMWTIAAITQPEANGAAPPTEISGDAKRTALIQCLLGIRQRNGLFFFFSVEFGSRAVVGVMLSTAFKSIDKDGSGSVSVNDFRGILARFGIRSGINPIIRKFQDKEGGGIQYNNFLRFFEEVKGYVSLSRFLLCPRHDPAPSALRAIRAFRGRRD